MCLPIGFPDEKQIKRAYPKVSKRRKTTDGGVLRLRLSEAKNPIVERDRKSWKDDRNKSK